MVELVKFLAEVSEKPKHKATRLKYHCTCFSPSHFIQSREKTIYELLSEVREAGDRLLFLMDYALLVEEDIKLNSQTFNWPARMEPIFEVCQQRLASKREVVEDKVKER